jgi:hypothetical protein
MKGLRLGCNGRGAQHAPGNPPSIDEQFRMVKASGVFDFFDRMPQPGEEAEYLRAAEKHNLPMTTGLWSYAMGRDGTLLEHNLRLSKNAGGECHNLMLFSQHADGHALSDDEVAKFYLDAYELAQRIGIEITIEVHIYMWSEDVRRVLPVAEKVRAHGVPFNFLLDHSHVLLKLDNPEEQELCGIRSDVEAGRLILDPFEDGNIIDAWIAQNMTVWHSVRPVAPNGPKNLWAKHPDGRQGRACQYPFTRPRPGEFHSPWSAYRVEPCKEVVRKMLRFHRSRAESRLRYLTTEIIDLPDYGAGARYSLFEQSVAIAQWIRATWADIDAAYGA